MMYSMLKEPQCAAGIAVGLGLPPEYFEIEDGGGTTKDTSYWVARILHYPPLSEGDAHVAEDMQKAALGQCTERSVQLSCGEHTDYGETAVRDI